MAGERSGPDWGLGNYERTAQVLLPAAQVLVDAAGPRRGESVVDVGCGTGNAALLAAARGAQVVAVDPSERLLELAHEAAEERDLPMTCQVGDAADLPVPASSVDCVLSNFGIIFAPDPHEAIAEVARVLKPAGRVVFTAWLPGGVAGALSAATQNLVRAALEKEPAPPGFPWHDEPSVTDLLAEHALQVAVRARHELVFAASSPEAYLDAELNNHPMAISAFAVLSHRGVDEAARDRLLEIVRKENEDPCGFRSTARYVVAVVRQAGPPPD